VPLLICKLGDQVQVLGCKHLDCFSVAGTEQVGDGRRDGFEIQHSFAFE
jgi:hypothetical protein